MATPNAQHSSPIVENEAAAPEVATLDRDDDEAISDLLDSALKNALITVGTIWFVATLVAIGAFVLQLQLIATIAAFVVATMMCAWLAGLELPGCKLGQRGDFLSSSLGPVVNPIQMNQDNDDEANYEQSRNPRR